MSDSFTILPLTEEVRNWLVTEGINDLPTSDGRQATFAELRSALAALPSVSVEWSSSVDFPDAYLSTASGMHTTIIIDGTTTQSCKFHFRGGHEDLIELVTSSLAATVGPLVIYAASGCFTKVIPAPEPGI